MIHHEAMYRCVEVYHIYQLSHSCVLRGGWKDRILRKASSQFGNNFELAGSEFQFLTTVLRFDVVNIFTQSNDNHRENI